MTKLVKFIGEVPELQKKVFPLKLVGQGGEDLTMTDTEQARTLEKFRLGKCNIKITRTSTSLWFLPNIP